MAEWALDDDQRHAFPSQLHSMRVSELVRRKAATDARCDGGPAQVRSLRHWTSVDLASVH